jgi:serine phosphatase RsbU (regulator of sigma subunit)
LVLLLAFFIIYTEYRRRAANRLGAAHVQLLKAYDQLEETTAAKESIDDIRGKQLLIYTDGLNEAENPQKELLGNKRLLELMADTQSLDSHQVIDMLKAAVEEHRAGADPNDDLTMLALKFG